MRLSVTLSNAKSLKHLGMKSIKEEGGDVSDTNRYRFFVNAQNERVRPSYAIWQLCGISLVSAA